MLGDKRRDDLFEIAVHDGIELVEREIDAVLKTHKDRILDVVYRAWAEGKKSAEIDALTETVRQALERMEKKDDTPL